VDVNLGSPLEDIARCAEQGNARLQYLFGFKLATGIGVPKDDAEAVRWYRLAAEQGYDLAQAALGGEYTHGDGVPKDDGESVRWYRLAAEQGYDLAQYQLGLKYANGEGVPEDQVLALMWWNLSTAQGHETAQTNKEIIEQRMTGEQIVEAQRRSREWLKTHPPDGGD